MKILIIGAHPDDIEPQMGGTVASLTKMGHQVLILQLTDTGDELVDIRTQESFDAASILGAKIQYLHYDQNNFKFERNLVQSIDKVIAKFKPAEIFTCWEHDSHQDHLTVSQAVIAASRKNDTNLYFFEPALPGGITTYEFKPNYFVDISGTIDIKIKSVEAHRSQVDKFTKGWIDAIYGRARVRGFQINTEYAEAFQIVKMIAKHH